MLSLEFLLASSIGLLTATGIYLILRARTFPVVLGLVMIGYAVNLFLFAMGRLQVNAPAVLTETTKVTDPLPQALRLSLALPPLRLLCNWHCAAVMNREPIMLIPKKNRP